MKEAVANEVVEGLKDAGVKFASFLPDSWLKPIYFRLTRRSTFHDDSRLQRRSRSWTLLRGVARRYEGGDVDGEHGSAHGL